MLGVNHHPEIVNRDRQITVLRKKRERGEVTEEWYAERLRTLTQTFDDEFGERLLHLTSSYTLLAPLRRPIYRAVAAPGRRTSARRSTCASGDLPLVYDLSADTSLPRR